MKKRLLIALLVVALIVILTALYLIFSKNYLIFKVTVPKDVKIKYMDVVDKVSKDKVQVNWMEVLAVDAAFNYGQVETATEKNIERIAERFIIKEKNNTYKLQTIESVVKSLNGKIEDVSKAQKYLKVFSDNRKIDKGHKRDFVESIKDDVMEESKRSRILPSVIIGQAALESNWGRSGLFKDYNNLFGIKADQSWKGRKINVSTSEYYNTKIKDDFRVYDTVKESIKDFGDFIKDNPRYTKAGVFNKKTYKEQIKAIEDAGYSTITDKKGEKVYAKYVIDIIYSNNLQILDWEVKKEVSP